MVAHGRVVTSSHYITEVNTLSQVNSSKCAWSARVEHNAEVQLVNESEVAILYIALSPSQLSLMPWVSQLVASISQFLSL